MRYHCSYDGGIQFDAVKCKKLGMDTPEAIEKKVFEVNDETVEIEMTFDRKKLLAYFSNAENYHEDQWREFLDRLAPMTQSGEIEFAGEEYDHWRFIYDNGTFSEENGHLVYGGVYGVYVIDYAESDTPRMRALYSDKELASCGFNHMKKEKGKKYLLAYLQFGEGITGHTVLKEVDGNE